MPTIDKFVASPVTKVIYLGHTGAGKTGSLAALAAAGYNVRILDLDNGAEVLMDFALNPRSPYRSAKPGSWTLEQCKGIEKRLHVIKLTEHMEYMPAVQKFVPKGDAWGRTIQLLNDWKDEDDQPGNIDKWGPQDVLVIDSLSRLSDAAMDFQLKMSGRLLKRPEIADWGLGQELIEDLLRTLYSPEVNTNIVVCAHIQFVETAAGPSRGFPQTLGKKLPPRIGQYFNHALLASVSGQGPEAKRMISTSTYGIIELKNTAPLRVKAEYPLDSGLADYFHDVRSSTATPPSSGEAAKQVVK
jgi:hypothetical protein